MSDIGVSNQFQKMHFAPQVAGSLQIQAESLPVTQGGLP